MSLGRGQISDDSLALELGLELSMGETMEEKGGGTSPPSLVKSESVGGTMEHSGRVVASVSVVASLVLLAATGKVLFYHAFPINIKGLW